MNDKDFDKLLKRQMQEDKNIPENINQLFLNFESEVNMKENNKKSNVVSFFRTATVAACAVVVLGIGGCTYAHVHGVETIISPMLRKIGINSKYEENATKFNEEVKKEDISVKLLDGAIDDTLLILGYEIDVPEIPSNSWIDIDGKYEINDISVKPINTTMDKSNDGKYEYYQIFDASEIKNLDSVNLNMNILAIREYTEVEGIDSVSAEYGKTFDAGWNFNETISVKNLEESKVYEFTDKKEYEIKENLKVEVTEFITGSYSNILKIKTDKTNYKGDAFEKLYCVLDEKGNEIARFAEERKEYDERVYNDRLVLGNIDRTSNLNIEVLFKSARDDRFEKVLDIPVELGSATEKVEKVESLVEYKSDDYTMKYNDNWNLIPNVDTTRVGPKSIYLGTLLLEIPSTTNSELKSSLYVKVVDENTTIEDYAKEIRKSNTESVSEYFEEKSSSEVKFKNQKGYQIVSETADGATDYIKLDAFTVANGKVYRIIFFGSDKEYNNLKSEVEEFISNFDV